MQLIPLTAPVFLQTKNKSVKMPILVSNQTPVNLLGRDALCKIGPTNLVFSIRSLYRHNRDRNAYDGCRAKSKCLL